jgi:hypothetical protein
MREAEGQSRQLERAEAVALAFPGLVECTRSGDCPS